MLESQLDVTKEASKPSEGSAYDPMQLLKSFDQTINKASKTSAGASLDNLNTASLYGSPDSTPQSKIAQPTDGKTTQPVPGDSTKTQPDLPAAGGTDKGFAQPVQNKGTDIAQNNTGAAAGTDKGFAQPAQNNKGTDIVQSNTGAAAGTDKGFAQPTQNYKGTDIVQTNTGAAAGTDKGFAQPTQNNKGTDITPSNTVVAAGTDKGFAQPDQRKGTDLAQTDTGVAAGTDKGLARPGTGKSNNPELNQAVFDNLNTAALYANTTKTDKALNTVATSDQASLAKTADSKEAHTNVGQSSETAEKGKESTTGTKPETRDTTKPKQEVPESEHNVKAGETLVGIARKTLGPKASVQEVLDYAKGVGTINGIDDPTKMQPGTNLTLPGQTKDGEWSYTNPFDKNEKVSWHADGSSDTKNTADGTNIHRTPSPTDSTCYTDEHTGPKPEDNYKEQYWSGNNYTEKTTTDANGTATRTGSDGVKRVTDKDGNYTETNPNEGFTTTFNKKENTETVTGHDGMKTVTHKNDGSTESTAPDGTVVTKTKDGSFTEERTDTNGNKTKREHQVDGQGGYTEKSTGANPKDNYTESYDSKSGTTVHVEGVGTDDQKTTIKTRDGKVTEETKDGVKDVTPKPGDYSTVDKSRKDMNDAVSKHIPQDKQAQYHKDMADFEKRAKAQNLPPEEVAKTYEQMTKLLNAPKDEAVVSPGNRAKLAESFMHQCAHPDQTDQGNHSTCNETTVAEVGLTKKPSTMAEIATSTALTGQFTAPDGKVIKVDKDSLAPGSEELANGKKGVGQRSYATQVLNVAMVNDVTQRRNPPEYFHQGTPDQSTPDDTGERLTDAKGNPLMRQVKDPETGSWKPAPITQPMTSLWEVSNSAERLLGAKDIVIAANDGRAGVEQVSSAENLAKRVQQAKDQGNLPLIIGVDANKDPITNTTPKPEDGYVSHVVTIDKYDPTRTKGDTIHISNQYGQPNDKWVKPEDLFNNSKGDDDDQTSN
jgi:hypothetical protein